MLRFVAVYLQLNCCCVPALYLMALLGKCKHGVLWGGRGPAKILVGWAIMQLAPSVITFQPVRVLQAVHRDKDGTANAYSADGVVRVWNETLGGVTVKWFISTILYNHLGLVAQTYSYFLMAETVVLFRKMPFNVIRLHLQYCSGFGQITPMSCIQILV